MLLRQGPLHCYRFQRFCTPPPTKQSWYASSWEKYDQWLAKYPRVYKYHRLMVDGSKHCYQDAKVFFRVSSQIRSGSKLQDFSRKDLEIYMLTSRDIVRVISILIFMWMPPPIAETYFVLMICFPRLLLTRHFWTPPQAEKFRALFFQHQTRHRNEIAEALPVELKRQSGRDDALSLPEALSKSKSQRLTFPELSKHAGAFSSLSIPNLPITYKSHLLSAHGMSSMVPFYSSRLRRRAELIRVIDSKLEEEDVDQLSISDLDQSLFVRKLDDAGLSEGEKRQLLRQWIFLTRGMVLIGHYRPIYNTNLFSGRSSDSFILHAPIFGTLKSDS